MEIIEGILNIIKSAFIVLIGAIKKLFKGSSKKHKEGHGH